MRSLLFFAISWISFTISYALIAPRSSQNLEADLFGNAPIDPTLISVEPSFEHMGPLDQPPDPYSSFFFDNHDPYLTAELDTNNFISEDNNLNQLTDSTFWLADDNFCDLDNTDENDLFRKVRRETSCRDPLVSQVKPRKQPKKNAQRSDLRFFYKDPMVLDISKAMCPPEIFGTSILPTCLTAFDGRSISVPGQDWFNLENVFRTSANDLFEMQTV